MSSATPGKPALKPCPFCGSKDAEEIKGSASYTTTGIRCTGCHAESHTVAGKGEAPAETWNRVALALGTMPGGFDAGQQVTLPSEPVTIGYTNWRGEWAQRTIIPRRLQFGLNAWHPELGYMLVAKDVAKGDERTFALTGFGPRPLSFPLYPSAKERLEQLFHDLMGAEPIEFCGVHSVVISNDTMRGLVTFLETAIEHQHPTSSPKHYQMRRDTLPEKTQWASVGPSTPEDEEWRALKWRVLAPGGAEVPKLKWDIEPEVVRALEAMWDDRKTVALDITLSDSLNAAIQRPPSVKPQARDNNELIHALLQAEPIDLEDKPARVMIELETRQAVVDALEAQKRERVEAADEIEAWKIRLRLRRLMLTREAAQATTKINRLNEGLKVAIAGLRIALKRHGASLPEVEKAFDAAYDAYDAVRAGRNNASLNGVPSKMHEVTEENDAPQQPASDFTALVTDPAALDAACSAVAESAYAEGQQSQPLSHGDDSSLDAECDRMFGPAEGQQTPLDRDTLALKMIEVVTGDAAPPEVLGDLDVFFADKDVVIFRTLAQVALDAFAASQQHAASQDHPAGERYACQRLISWLHEQPRRPACTAFTAGALRNVGYAIEGAVRRPTVVPEGVAGAVGKVARHVASLPATYKTGCFHVADINALLDTLTTLSAENARLRDEVTNLSTIVATGVDDVAGGALDDKDEEISTLTSELADARAALLDANDLDTDPSRSTDDCVVAWRVKHASTITAAQESER